ncbi:MAG: helix-turn-helix domain-containing protein [Ignavibacteriales bacterium]
MGELLTIKETTERLKCSRQFLYTLFREGKLRRIKFNKKVLIDSDDIAKLVKAQKEKK